MKANKEFEEMFAFLKDKSSETHRPKDTFAWGVLNGYNWRQFQELHHTMSDGKKVYFTWVGFYDENKEGSKVPAYYSIKEIKKWINKHPLTSNN